jgi:predicted nucleotidyltransferase
MQPIKTSETKIQLNIQLPTQQLAQFCQKWLVEKLEFFGSVVRADFTLDSDIDILVRFSPHAEWSLFDMAGMQLELEALFGRSVDLVERVSVEQSKNWIRRQMILESAVTIYENGQFAVLA